MLKRLSKCLIKNSQFGGPPTVYDSKTLYMIQRHCIIICGRICSILLYWIFQQMLFKYIIIIISFIEWNKKLVWCFKYLGAVSNLNFFFSLTINIGNYIIGVIWIELKVKSLPFCHCVSFCVFALKSCGWFRLKFS